MDREELGRGPPTPDGSDNGGPDVFVVDPSTGKVLRLTQDSGSEELNGLS